MHANTSTSMFIARTRSMSSRWLASRIAQSLSARTSLSASRKIRSAMGSVRVETRAISHIHTPWRPLHPLPLIAHVRSMFIQTEQTPSLDSLKFKPGVDVLGEAMSTIEILSVHEATSSPLAKQLFKIEGVTSILFGPDFITITKDPDTSWQLMKPDIYGIITDFFAALAGGAGEPVFSGETAPSDTEILPGDDEVVAMIKELLNTRIRPTIQDDGGDIQYMGFDPSTGIVRLKLKGACRTCDSSVVTLKKGVENMLQYFVPEVKAIEQVLEEYETVANEEFTKLEDKLHSTTTPHT